MIFIINTKFFRILPCLVKDCVNPVMIPFVLPNIFYVCENCTKDEFVNHILPCLKPIMKVHEPVQVCTFSSFLIQYLLFMFNFLRFLLFSSKKWNYY